MADNIFTKIINSLNNKSNLKNESVNDSTYQSSAKTSLGTPDNKVAKTVQNTVGTAKPNKEANTNNKVYVDDGVNKQYQAQYEKQANDNAQKKTSDTVKKAEASAIKKADKVLGDVVENNQLTQGQKELGQKWRDQWNKEDVESLRNVDNQRKAQADEFLKNRGNIFHKDGTVATNEESQIVSEAYAQMKNINEQVKSLNDSYESGQIDSDTYTSNYKDLVEKFDALQSSVGDYEIKTGWDYYDAIKDSGTQEAYNLTEYLSHFDDNVLERLTNQLGANIVEYANAPIQAMSLAYNSLTGEVDSNFNQLAKENVELAQQYREYTYGGANGFEKVTNEIIGSMMPQLIATGIAIATGGSSTALMGFKGGIDDAYQMMNEGYTTEEALVHGTMIGTISYLVEKIGADDFTKLLTGASGQWVIADSLWTHVVDYKQLLKTGVNSMLAESVEEFVEGYATAIGNDIFNSIYSTNFDGVSEIDLAQLGKESLYAGISALLMTGAQVGSQSIKLRISNQNGLDSARQCIAQLDENIKYCQTQEELKTYTDLRDKIASTINDYNSRSELSNSVREIKNNLPSVDSYNDVMNTLAEAYRYDISKATKMQMAMDNARKTVNSALLNRGIQTSTRTNSDTDVASMYLNGDEKVRKNILEVGEVNSKLGTDIRIGDSKNDAEFISKTLDGKTKKAYYDPKTNEAVVNVDEADGVIPAIMHELTHSLEKSKGYQKIVDVINKNGGNVKTSEDVAYYIENNIANEDFIREIVANDSSLISKFARFIKAIPGKENRTRIENAWMNAFRDYDISLSGNGDIQYAMDEIYVGNWQTKEGNEKQIQKYIEKVSNSNLSERDKSELLSDYIPRGTNSLVMSDLKIDELFRKYSADIENYSKAYIGWITPQDFLALTTNDKTSSAYADTELYNKIKEESKELNPVQFRSNDNFYLEITDESENKALVEGHEGRHRMFALDSAGIKYVPIVIVNEDTKYSKAPMKYISLGAQEFVDINDYNANDRRIVYDLTPINKKYENEIKQKYGTKSAEYLSGEAIQYSLGDYNDGRRIQENSTRDISTRTRGTSNSGTNGEIREMFSSVNETNNSSKMGKRDTVLLEGNLNKDEQSSFSNEENVARDINSSMTMNDAKRMIETAFTENGIKEWYDDKYKTADEWLKDEGIEEVATYIDNTSTTVERYINNINNDNFGDTFTTEDILEAYLNGTLTGKIDNTKPNRLDVSKGNGLIDNKFYAPKDIENVKELYNKALERVTNNNRDEVYKARADLVIASHNKGTAETIGISQSELNSKVRSWSRYSNEARNLSNRINEGVAKEYKWTGIENSNILNRMSVSNEQMESLVKEVIGDSDGYQRKYIVNTMLALDTHIDYKNLSFEFDHKSFGRPSIRGAYVQSENKIYVGNGYQNTVSHEIGHYIDSLWGNELGFKDNLTQMSARYNEEAFNFTTEQKQFIDNFKKFMISLQQVNDLNSEYTNRSEEIFARFVAKFTEWTMNKAGATAYNENYFNDNFTQSQFIEFAHLLQEKASLNLDPVTSLSGNNDVNYEMDENDFYLPKGEQRDNTPQNRDINFKAQTEYGKTRLFARTMGESTSATTNELANKLVNDYENISYETYTNKRLLKNAWDNLTRQVNNSVIDDAVKLEQDIAEKWLQDSRLNSQHFVEGQILVSEIAKTGNTDLALRIAEKLAEDYTEAGRAVQSARVYKTLTPEGKLRALEKNIENANKRLKARGFSDIIDIDKETKKEYLKALVDNDTQKAEEIEQNIQKHIIDSMPSTLLDKINSWRYISMLGNPKTMVRNIIGNAISSGMAGVKDAIKVGFESAYAKKHQDYVRTTSFLGLKDKSLIDFARKTFPSFEKSQVRQGKYKNEGDLKQSHFNSKTLQSVETVVNWAMNNEKFGDTAFVRERYVYSLAQYMKANGMDANVDQNSKEFKAAQEYAWKEAERAAFHEVNELAKAINKFGATNKFTSFIKESLIPFTTTPLNVARQGINYSPLGLIYHSINDWQYVKNGMDSNGNSYTMENYLDYLAQGTTGAGIFLIGAFLAKMGILRTKDDDKDRLQNYQEDIYGEQDYSITLGDKGSYTIDWATPLILPLALGAEIFNALGGEMEISDFADLAGTVLNPLSETTMLSSLQSALKSYGNNDSGSYLSSVLSTMFSNYINQMIPTLFGQIKRTFDGTRYTTSGSKNGTEKLIKQIDNKIGIIPDNISKIQPYINSKGETVNSNPTDNNFFNFLYQTMSPGYIQKNKATENDDEITRLYDVAGDTGVLPSSKTSSFTYEGEDYKLTNDDYTAYNQAKLSSANYLVNEFLDSKEYDTYDDDTRTYIIGKLRDYSNSVAKNTVLGSKGIEFDNSEYSKVQSAIDNGMSVVQYYENAYVRNNIESLKDENGKTIANSKAMQVRKAYEDNGTYEAILKSIESGETSADDWGLSKTVIGYSLDKFKSYYNSLLNGKKENSSKADKTKTSSKTSKTKTEKTTKVSTTNSTKTTKSKETKQIVKETNTLGGYLKAYASSMGYSQNSATVCPKCGTTVTSSATRCPVCGTNL